MDLMEIRELMEQAQLEEDWVLVAQAINMLEEYVEDRKYGGCEHDEDFND